MINQNPPTPAAPAALRTLGILGSGKGSNFAAILRAIQAGALKARVGLVLSDNPHAGILDLGRAAGIEVGTIDEPRFKTRLSPEVERETVQRLLRAGVDLVVLAGYMRMVKEPLLAAFPGRILNIHPSLLPKFPGLESWRQALEAGESETGCTVHWVDAGMDTGPVIAQERVPILPSDSPESLHARIQEAEHRILPRVLAKICA